MKKIDFSDRSKRDKRHKKDYYTQHPESDFNIFIAETGFDNSTGDYNWIAFSFIAEQGLCEKFQEYLQDLYREHQETLDEANL